MNIFLTIRNSRTRKARIAMAAAMVAWLGFLLQPCVMAATPGGTTGIALGIEFSIVMHHGPSVLAEQCLHCEDASDPLPGVCDDIVASGNSSSSKPIDTGSDGGGAAAPAVTVPDISRIMSEPGGPPRAEDLPPPVALTEAYCVYLE